MIDAKAPDYLDTKLVRQGVKQLDSIFQELADWIDQKLDTKVLNVYYDKIKEDKNRPRLSIIFEYFSESKKFTDQRGNYDSAKQAMVADEFRQILSKDKNSHGRIFTRLFKKSPAQKFDTERLLVIFTAFEPVAREEVNKNIPQAEIDNLKQQLKTKDIWEIYREFGTTTYFFHTAKQIDRYSKDGTTDQMNKQYLELLKKYDEFDYINSKTFTLSFDSKENFDNVYEGSWFNYFKR
jgi:hypothetical protein